MGAKILTGQAILERLAAGVPEPIRSQLPPPCLLDMQAEPIEFVEGERLVMRFPVLERSRRTLLLTGRALLMDGKVAALAQATCQIV